MSEELALPIVPASTIITNASGNTVTFDVADSSATYSMILPTANAAGSLLNNGTGTLSWGAGSGATSVAASDGTAAAPSISFSADTDTGLYRIGDNNLGFTIGGAQKISFDTTTLSLVSCNLSLPAVLSFTGATGVNILSVPDNLADAFSIKEGANAYMTFVTTDAAEQVNVIKDLNLSTVLKVGGTQVLTSQQTAVTDAAVVTTVGANTGTSGAGLSLIGDTSTVDQSGALMNDLVALQEDILDIRTQLNTLLARLRTHGIIAT